MSDEFSGVLGVHDFAAAGEHPRTGDDLYLPRPPLFEQGRRCHASDVNHVHEDEATVTHWRHGPSAEMDTIERRKFCIYN